MNRDAIFNIALEIWGIVICVLAFVALLLERNQRKDKKGVSLCMEISCILLLVCDSLAWCYRGNTSDAAYYIVRIANFGVFFINYLYMSLFMFYLLINLNRGEDKMPIRARLVLVLSGVGILMLIASQFSDGLFYYIDAQNIYHRNRGYILSQIIAVIGLTLCFTIIIQYRKRIEKAVFWATMSYFILPCISTVVVMFYYGLSLQTISVVMSTQIMFVVDMIDVDRKLVRSRLEVEHAKYEAEHDSLTGLYNKAAGMEKIQDYIRNMSDDDKASVLFVDIDDFKGVNDTYGHAVGDYWIEVVGKLLKSECDSEDIACRFGGDEFVLIHKGIADVQSMKSKMKRFARKLQLKATEHGQDVHCSSGVCQIIGSGHDPEECINMADNALYEAKKKGKHTSVIHSIDRDGAENVTILDKINADAREIQERIAARISYMYTVMIYVNIHAGDYRVIKGEEDFQRSVEHAESYEQVVSIIENRLRSERSRQIIGEFLDQDRMEGQNSDALSVSYANNEGGAALMHVLPVRENGDCGFFIVVQNLDVYVS